MRAHRKKPKRQAKQRKPNQLANVSSLSQQPESAAPKQPTTATKWVKITVDDVLNIFPPEFRKATLPGRSQTQSNRIRPRPAGLNPIKPNQY